MNSLKKKMFSIMTSGLDPIVEGRSNYKANITPIENKAKERAETCVKCVEFVQEPIAMFREKDERIEELSDMMCDVCGCPQKYLVRQDVKKCKKWKR